MINSIQRDQRRRTLVLKYQAKRVQHKTLLQNCKISLQLNKNADDLRRSYNSPKVPRNGSVTRVRNRCVLTARSRGVLRFCKLSRIRLRELAAQGALNGVSKASW